MPIAISEVTLGINAVFDRSEFDEHESLHFQSVREASTR